MWREAKKNAIPFEFAQNYNGPGRWSYGLGFVESGGFIGGTGSFAGYESTAMYSPARRTTIEVVSTKQPNAITPPPMFQALAMAVFGDHIGFGLTLAQALEPNYFGRPPAVRRETEASPPFLEPAPSECGRRRRVPLPRSD